MLREQSKLLQQGLFLLDLFLIALGWILSYYLRFDVLTWGNLAPPLWRPLSRYIDYLPVLLGVWGLVFIASGLYRPREVERFYSMVYSVGRAVFWGMAVAFMAMFLYRQFSFSRIHMVLFGVTTSGLMVLSRVLIYRIVHGGRKHAKNLRRVLVVGAGKVGHEVAEVLQQYPWMGFQLVGYLDDEVEGEEIRGKTASIGAFLDEAEKQGKPIHQVYITLPLRAADRIEALLSELSSRLAHVYLVPDIFRFNLLNHRISDMGGLPIIHLIDESPLDIRRFIKRLIDIVGAATAMLLLSPLLLVVAIGVKISSRGPIFYRQDRMGMNGEHFKMIKFRSMPVNAEQSSGPVWAKSGESRATPFGAFIRKTSLDELPQFWNVLIGEMSLVGPRPERPFFIDQFKQYVPGYMLRHKMKAGLTGWAQVNGWRGNTSIEKRIEADLFYIQNWSLKLDIKIMLMTVWKVFQDENAY
ncbi:MAG: undecaprenyl-phosphate glucose phosphotransferase [Bacteroidetes Order II. Incertae sedis bacterium]|nr:undecaprenyl-phosphate glucose phosphotransferase [Bacteroidetes Order II. bacterium]